MSSQQTQITDHSVETPSGRISYATAGTGPVALFVHGVLLNKHLWRHQLAKLSDIRHCIAVDLLAHGETEITPNQDVSVTANAKMLKEVLDALKIDRIDLVGNDSGGGIAQIFATLNPERVRTLTLTNCDAHDNWPPEAFKPFVEMVKAGGLRDTLSAMLAKKAIFRSPGALGPAYERPESVTDEDIETYLRPLVRTEQRTLDLQRFVQAFDNNHTRVVEPKLRELRAPTLIVWGTDDVYFPVKWAHWLAETIPGSEAASGAERSPDLLPRRTRGRVQSTIAQPLTGNNLRLLLRTMRPTQHLLNSIALYGTVVVYIGMSGKPAMVSNPQIIFQSQSVRGFWILNWFKSPNPEKIKALYEELAAMVASEVISIPVAGQFSFNQYQKALAVAAKYSGKAILTPKD